MAHGQIWKAELTAEIVSSIVLGIEQGDPVNEIKDMIIDSAGFKQALRTWRDPKTGLNIMQFIVLHDRPEVMKIFLGSEYIGIFDNYSLLSQTVETSVVHFAALVGSRQIIDDKLSEFVDDFEGLSLLLEHRVTVKGTQQKTLLDICIDGGYLDCCHVITKAIFRHFPSMQLNNTTSMHHACFLGAERLLELCLKESHRDLSVRSPSGLTPLHVCCLMLEPKCMTMLLQAGADMNKLVDNRPCLYLVLESPYSLLLQAPRPGYITATFTQHTPLNLIIRSLQNQSPTITYSGDVWRTIVKEHSVFYRSFTKQTSTFLLERPVCQLTPSFSKPADLSQDRLLDCLNVLLSYNFKRGITHFETAQAHSALYVLMFMSSYDRRYYTNERYFAALHLLLHYGADPHIQPVKDLPPFVYMLSLLELIGDHWLEFIVVFLQNGVDPDLTYKSQEVGLNAYHSSMLYPLNFSAMHQHPMALLELLANHMSTNHLLRSVRITLYHHYPMPSERYSRAWKTLFLAHSTVRSLRHCSKLVILQTVKRKYRLISELSLPNILKAYLTNAQLF